MDTIVFDLDDTLYDRTQPLKNAFLALDNSKHIDFIQFQRDFQINSEIASTFVRENNWSLEESHIYRIKETLKKFEVQISDESAVEFQKIYLENQEYIKLEPQTLEILDFLHERKIRTFIITNGPVNHQRNKIKNLGLDRYFEPSQIIVSAEEGIAKPDPKIFELAESRFELDKDCAWYIGDNYENDIIGATNVGWRTVWFNRDHEQDIHKIATKTVFSVAELKQAFLKLFS